MVETIILFITCIALMFAIISAITKIISDLIGVIKWASIYETHKLILESIISGICIAYIIYFCN